MNTFTTLNGLSRVLSKAVGPNYVVILSTWTTGYFLSLSIVFIRMAWIDAVSTNFCGRFIWKRFRKINVKELSNAKIEDDDDACLMTTILAVKIGCLISCQKCLVSSYVLRVCATKNRYTMQMTGIFVSPLCFGRITSKNSSSHNHKRRRVYFP
jgi:hypothetical protein